MLATTAPKTITSAYNVTVISTAIIMRFPEILVLWFL